MPNKLKYRLLLSSIVVAAGMLQACKDTPTTSTAPRVAVASAVQMDVPLTGTLVGETRGSVDIDIRARVDGQIEGVHFLDGQPVEKDQLLYTIDPKPLEARVIAAESELDKAVTALTKAKADLARVGPLAKIDAVSKRELDSAIAAQQSAEASVNTQKAHLENARIQLAYARITAPASGVIGISKARVGDYVGKEPSPIILNTITQNDPIRVRVALGEREYLTFAKQHLSSRGGSAASKQEEEKGTLKLILADETVHPWEGKVTSVNSQLDPKTGTLSIEATFPNPQLLVRPGQYAKVQFVKEVRKDAVVVWQRAVQELQDVYQVYVVDENSTVIARQIQPGEKVDGLWIIEKGLHPNERVVVEGIQRVRPGMRVEALSPEDLNVTPPVSSLLAGDDSLTRPTTNTSEK